MSRLEDFLFYLLMGLIVLLVAVLVVGLIVCLVQEVNNNVDEGICIELKYEPAHTKRWLQPMVAGKVTTLIPRTRQVPDRWFVAVRGLNRHKKVVTDWWEVPKYAWDRIQIGDWLEKGEVLCE